jgi:hypothetical protein
VIPGLRELALTGTVKNGELRVVCPLCGNRSLDIRLGVSALLASCLNDKPPSCRGRGYTILGKLGLPSSPLPDAAKDWARREVFGTDADDRPAAAPVEVLHAVYSAWLAQCPLLSEDYERLRARGFGPTDPHRFGYRSWRGRLDIAKLPRVNGVPGVHGGRLSLDHERYAGILVPVRNLDGLIYALKVRLAVPDEGGKMRTFSSAAWGGPSAAGGVHYPKGAPRKAPKVWIVEGEIKADLVFARTGQAVLSIPGTHGA